MVRFVTIKKFCELTGYTSAAMYSRRNSGEWLTWNIWCYEPGTKKILIDIQAFEKWVEQGQGFSVPHAPLTKSPSLPRLDPPARASKRSPLRPIFER
ncbi:excisionase [Paraburkholderia terrae]|uniref:excisionase n=1 Tax=Paraburkholderia terrae TaxID=311230 RepID=UPI0020C0C9BA|nr:excisionase [Paraburkholderia terrae]